MPTSKAYVVDLAHLSTNLTKAPATLTEPATLLGVSSGGFDFDLNGMTAFLALELSIPAKRITTWASEDSQSPPIAPEQGLADRSGALLDVLAKYTRADIPRFRAAIAEGEHRALEALQHAVNDIRNHHPELIPTLFETCRKWFESEQYQFVAFICPDIAALAWAAGFDWYAIELYYFAAQSFWTNDDETSAVAAYELAISLCEQARTVDELQRAKVVKRLGVLHDDLGLALVELERFEEAIAHHKRSFEVDPDPLHRLITRKNLAVVYADLGEYALAARESEKVWEEMSSGKAGDLPLWATALETWAAALIQRGRVETALGLLEIAAAGLQLPSATIDARLRNAGYRLQGYKLVGDYPKAAAVFREMWGVALERFNQLNIDHFFYGHNYAVSHILPASSLFWTWYALASAAMGAHRWEQAIDFYMMAVPLGREAKDQLSLMRCAVDIAAAKGRAGAIDEALQDCEVVRRAAMEAGLALPVALSASTLARLMQRGSDQGARVGALATIAEALAYARLHDLIADETNLPPDDDIKRLGRVNLGVLEAQVAEAANDAHAYDLAEEYFHRAISSSQRFADRFDKRIRSFELDCNVGLLRALDAIPERSADAAVLARELRTELGRADSERTERILILNYLGTRGTNTRQSLADLRAATELLESLRAERPRGVARSELDRDYPVYPLLLRRLQDSDACTAEEFSVLQTMRARQLMETLTAASGDADPYQPVGVDEIRQLLLRQPRLTTFVDVTAIKNGLRAYLVDDAGVHSVDVSGDVTPLHNVQWGDVRERAAEVVALVAHLPILAELASAITAELRPGSTLLIAVDDELANLPLHAVPVGNELWGDVVSIGRIPAAGVLRFTPSNSNRGWSDHSVVAGNSNDDLPGAQKECEAVAGLLGVEPLVREDCTFNAVRDALIATPNTRLDVVHLAVHGRADARRGGRSSLLFAGEHPTWVPFADLAALHWNANLIVFSGCSTAVGGPRHGAGLYGVAQSAAEAGATTVIASLWPVNDTIADIFMEAFYTELSRRRGSGPVDLRELMDHARTTLRQTALLDRHAVRRDGRELIIDDRESDSPPVEDEVQAAMMHWAPFVLIGEPTLVV